MGTRSSGGRDSASTTSCGRQRRRLGEHRCRRSRCCSTPTPATPMTCGPSTDGPIARAHDQLRARADAPPSGRPSHHVSTLLGHERVVTQRSVRVADLDAHAGLPLTGSRRLPSPAVRNRRPGQAALVHVHCIELTQRRAANRRVPGGRPAGRARCRRPASAARRALGPISATRRMPSALSRGSRPPWLRSSTNDREVTSRRSAGSMSAASPVTC